MSSPVGWILFCTGPSLVGLGIQYCTVNYAICVPFRQRPGQRPDLATLAYFLKNIKVHRYLSQIMYAWWILGYQWRIDPYYNRVCESPSDTDNVRWISLKVWWRWPRHRAQCPIVWHGFRNSVMNLPIIETQICRTNGWKCVFNSFIGENCKYIVFSSPVQVSAIFFFFK